MSAVRLTAAEYHADPAPEPSLSSSIIRVLLNQSPAHAWQQHPRLNPALERREAAHFDVGTAAHAMLLEGRDAFGVVDADDWRTSAAKEQRDLIRAEGRTPLLAAQAQQVEEMVEAFRVNVAALDLDPAAFVDGQPETALVWEERGVHCRALLDWLHTDCATIDDYKTTSRTASPDVWGRTMFGFGGDVQAAFYRRAVQRTFDVDPVFRFIVQETYPPYAVSAVTPDSTAYAVANRKIDHAIKTWRECLKTGVWSAYPAGLRVVESPPWEEARWLERELREAS